MVIGIWNFSYITFSAIVRLNDDGQDVSLVVQETGVSERKQPPKPNQMAIFSNAQC